MSIYAYISRYIDVALDGLMLVTLVPFLFLMFPFWCVGKLYPSLRNLLRGSIRDENYR